MPFSATVLEIPDVDIQKFIPFSLEELQRKWDALGEALLQTEWMVAYLNWVSISLRKFLIVLLLLFPIVLMLWMIIKNSLLSPRPAEDRNVDSKPLRIFKKLTFKPFFTAKEWLLSFKSFLGDRKYLVAIFVLIWTVNLNMITILIEAIAFYFYFASSFEFADLGGQGLKLLIDVIIMFSGAAFPFWLISFWNLFDKARRALGYDKLEHNERKNRGFINSLNICVIICGAMGVSKTTALVDMAISQSIMDRNDAFDKIQNYRYRLPNFPWCNVELAVLEMQRAGDLKRLFHIHKWLEEKKSRYGFFKGSRYVFGYDFLNFSQTYDDGLKVSDIWMMVENYAQLFYIYSLDCPLVVSNLSIRDCTNLVNTGHTPKWDNELFKRPSVPVDDPAHHSHILDFDILRSQKRVVPGNPNYGLLEFATVCITEVGKEMGNSKENIGLSKKSEEANALNDGTIEFLKVCRTLSTVDYKPFFRLFTDEQRPESLGSNARDVFSLLWISKKDDTRLAAPGFLFENILHDILKPIWKEFDGEYSKNRSDNTLFKFLFHNSLSSFFRYYERLYNTFGYDKLHIETEDGRMEDGVRESHDYFISKKKDHSRTFATDCCRELVVASTSGCQRGLVDLPEYRTERPSDDEFDYQNSYFIARLKGGFKY